MAAGDENQIVIDGRAVTAAELVAMADELWTPPETEEQRSARRRTENAEALAKAQAEVDAMNLEEVGDWLLEGQAQQAAWGELEEIWAVIRCLRNRAPYN